MGFIRSTVVLAVLTVITGILIDKYSPSTLDVVINHPSVKPHADKVGKFLVDTSKVVQEKTSPLYSNILKTIQPYINFVKQKINENLSGKQEFEDSAQGRTDKSKKFEKGKKSDKLDSGSPQSSGRKVFTAEELKKYNGKPGSKGLYLAILGQVFNVKKGKDHYGPGGGYEFFAGRDASRAYVTGDFSEEGLIDDIRGLTPQDYLGLKTWLDFYHKDYKYVGKVAGRYYTADGAETEYKTQATRWIQAAQEDKAQQVSLENVFPSCNSEWGANGAARVWCTQKSGGIDRSWVGVPRKLFVKGKAKPRCACVKDFGPSSTGNTNTQRGDLDDPRLKEYKGCPPKESSCDVSKDND